MMRESTFRLTAEFIAESCSGRLAMGSGIVADRGVSIDSRSVGEREAFVALRGPRFDGHDFLQAAVDRGAVGLVVAHDRANEATAIAARATDRVFVVSVDDPERALVEVARAWVSVLGPAVVAVTGSVGKTTTKDLAAAVLGARYLVHSTKGNLNNRLGLSLTCLRLVPAHDLLLVEMGMNAPGEIAELCTIAPPKVGVVTCVAPVHLEHLGSLDGVAAAKAELIRALPPDGRAVLNADDGRVAAMATMTRATPLFFGTSAGPDGVRIAGVDTDAGGHPTVTLEVGGRTVTTRLSLVGAHHASNAAAALAAGVAMGVDPVAACAAMEVVAPGKHRMNVVSVGTLRILDDCYNASPRSMSAALRTLASVSAEGRRMAVLGDMLELGDATEGAHRDAGRDAAAAGVDRLVAVGRQAGQVRDGALAAGMASSGIFVAPDNVAAAAVALAVVRPRDTVLVKGSRGVGLEHVVEALAAKFAGGPEGN
jgi:UDP-N-acetylmuramoyl-tripeptide--D-alanyl-D-alanine ligase